MYKATQPAQERRYRHLDSIAFQRFAAKKRELEERISSAERSAASVLLNPSGQQVHGYMASQGAQRVAELREQLKALESLSADELVRHYCEREIAEAEAPEVRVIVNSDGSPLARGNYAQPISPGMG